MWRRYFQYINKSVRISKERLDNLEFFDVLQIREAFLTIGFCDGYDTLLKSVKESVDLDDPEKLILHAEEITGIAIKLRNTFSCQLNDCLLYTSPSPRDLSTSRMPSSA